MTGINKVITYNRIKALNIYILQVYVPAATTGVITFIIKYKHPIFLNHFLAII